MASEFEVKYRSSPAAMELLEAAYGPFETVTMETAYYDAPERPLAARYWTLRRRLENGRSICALKTPGEGLLRGEWETECDSIEAAIPALLALGAPEELAALTAGGLTQTCAARFTRRTCLVSTEIRKWSWPWTAARFWAAAGRRHSARWKPSSSRAPRPILWTSVRTWQSIMVLSRRKRASSPGPWRWRNRENPLKIPCFFQKTYCNTLKRVL